MLLKPLRQLKKPIKIKFYISRNIIVVCKFQEYDAIILKKHKIIVPLRDVRFSLTLI